MTRKKQSSRNTRSVYDDDFKVEAVQMRVAEREAFVALEQWAGVDGEGSKNFEPRNS